MTIELRPPTGGAEAAAARSEQRRGRERRWRDLSRLQRDLAMLVVERMMHGILERDAVDDLLENVETQLARLYPRRWAAGQPHRLAESATWWHPGAHVHRDGMEAVLACERCRMLGSGLSHWLQLPA